MRRWAIIERVNKYRLPAKLLKAATAVLADLPQESRRTFEGRAIAVIHLLDELNYPGGSKRALIATSIQFRLEALARLRDCPAYKAWAVRAREKSGPDFVHSDLLAAAAVEPIIGEPEGHEVRFDETKFFERVLRITKADRI